MTQISAEGTQSALDEMVAGIRGRKVDAVLTPVGTEKNGPLDGRHPQAPFPFDDADMIRGAIRDGYKALADLKYQIDFIGTGLVTLATIYGMTDEQRLDAQKHADTLVAATNHLAEQTQVAAAKVVADSTVEGGEDPDFATEFAAKAKAAQDATFKPFEEPKPETVEGDAAADGWQCTEHGTEHLTVLTSRKGRKYRACNAPDCKQFEKER